MTNAAWKLIIGRTLPLDPPELRELDETALVRRLLTSDPAAWREFMRRYDSELRGQVAGTLSEAMRSILDSDAVDDVIGDLYLRIINRNMRKLRFWASSRSGTYTLRRWLGLLANGIALNHIRDAVLRGGASFDADDEDEYHDRRKKRNGPDADPNRGAAWIAAWRDAEIGVVEEDEDEPKTRNRICNDDKDDIAPEAAVVEAERIEEEAAELRVPEPVPAAKLAKKCRRRK
jgi:hypothetical protein